MSATPRPVRRRATSRTIPQEAKDQATRELKAIPILKCMLEEFRGDLEGLRFAHFQGLVVWPANLFAATREE